MNVKHQINNSAQEANFNNEFPRINTMNDYTDNIFDDDEFDDWETSSGKLRI